MLGYSKLLNLVFFLIGISLYYIFAFLLQDFGCDFPNDPPLGYYWGAIYLGYMALLISPMGDHWLNLTIGARRMTTAETQRIDPLIAAIQDDASRRGFPFPKQVRVGIMTEPFPNAMAFGHSMIAVTTGLLKSFDDDAVKAVLAHETGHLVHKDSIADLLTISAFGPLLWLGRILIKMFLFCLKEGEMMLTFLALILCILFFPASLSAIAFISFEALKAFTSRKAEFKADKYASQVAGKDGLISFLEQIEHLDTVPHGEFLAAYTASHPPTLVRIDHIYQHST